MRAVVEVLRLDGGGRMLVFECPACKCDHSFDVERPGSRWTWNGDAMFPTVSPSLVVKLPRRGGGEQRCHLFLRAGVVEFLSDCSHSLAGRSVRLSVRNF